MKKMRLGCLKAAQILLQHESIDEKKSRNGEGRRNERSDRGGGCLVLITGLCLSFGQVFSKEARHVACNVQFNFLCTALRNVL